MIRPLESLPRWVLVLEMLVCFLPLTLLFSAVVLTGLHGGFTLQAGLLYCSGTVLGPLGLVAALRSIFFKSGGMSRAIIGALCLLAAWTLAAYSAQILTFGQSHLSDWWREFVIIAVLPTLAVIAWSGEVATAKEGTGPRIRRLFGRKPPKEALADA